MATERLKVEGMTCQNCVRHVKTALEGVDGVDTAEVSLEAGLAVVEAGAGAERGRRCGRRSKPPATGSPKAKTHDRSRRAARHRNAAAARWKE